jgi:stringent starvation protein B
MSVIGIYARENGKGMVFGEDDGPDGDGSPTEPTDPKPDKTRPALKIVK